MKKNLRVKGRRKMIIGCIIALIVAVGIYIYCGNSIIGITEYDVHAENIPEAFDGFKIAQISDLHNTEFGSNQNNLIAKLKAIEPDIIVVTGDLIDSRRTNVEIAMNAVTQAAEMAPVYYVTGNHESRVSKEYRELEEKMKKAGVRILHDESELIERNGQTIKLLGLDDLTFHAPEDSTSAARAVMRKKLDSLASDDVFTAVLSHRPELFNDYCEAKVDLVFCGHAHGGQFRIPGIGGVLAPNQGFWPEWSEGCIEKDSTKMIVSRGLGNSIFPFRLNNPPELVVVTLEASAEIKIVK